MVEVTLLAHIGTRGFGPMAHNLTVVRDFLVVGEIVQPRGRGKALESLPIPWDQFAAPSKEIHNL